MPLPVALYPGIVSIYGAGNAVGINNITPPANFLFGIIDQTWGSMGENVSAGDSVMFNDKEIIGRVVYGNWTYTLIEQNKIKLTETPPP